MAIDATAKKSNVRMSIKKYLTDTLKTTHGKSIFFDLGFLLPKQTELTEWISIQFGSMVRGGMSDFNMEIICATRGDCDGDSLSVLADLVFEVMTDLDQQDGKRRILFYDVEPEPWVQIGALLVRDISDSEEMLGVDNTKYQILTIRIKWVAKA